MGYGEAPGRYGTPTRRLPPYNRRTMAGLPATAERDAKGHFVKGNRGRPGRVVGYRLLPTNYHDALRRARSPSELMAIVQRAVRDARAGDRYARYFSPRFLGLDSLRITVNPEAPGPPMPSYHLDALSPEEFEVWDRLSVAKMLIGPDQDAE